MKKRLILILILMMLMSVVGCQEEPIEETKLYPAYISENNIKKWGFIDETGEYIVEAIYDTVKEFKDGYALVEKDGLFGIISDKGNEIIEVEYDNIRDYDSGFWVAFKEDDIILINDEGEKINLGEKYSNIGLFRDGYFSVMTIDEKGNPKFGYINELGEQVLDFQYDLAYDFILGRAIVMKGEKYYLIDKVGKVFKELNYELIRPFKSGNLYLYKNSEDRYGLLDKDGKVVIPAKHSSIIDYKDDLVVFADDKSGKELLGLMDIGANVKLEAVYDDIKILDRGYLAISEETGILGKNLYKIVNEKLEEISPDKYYNVGGSQSRIHKDLISVCDDKKTFLIDLSGNVSDIIEPIVGWGEIWTDGNVIRTSIDEELFYYAMDKTVIWEADETFRINDKIQVLQNEEVSDLGINIKYPRIIGVDDKSIQEDINERLLNDFVRDVRFVDKDKSRLYEYYKTTYKIGNMGKILQIQKRSRALPKEVLKEKVRLDSYNIDLETGDFYVLDDILKAEDEVIDDLNEKILENIDNPMDIDFRLIKNLGRHSDFYYLEDALIFNLEVREDSFVDYPEQVIVPIKDIETLIDFESTFFQKISKGEVE